MSEQSLYLIAYVLLLSSSLIILRIIVRREYRNLGRLALIPATLQALLLFRLWRLPSLVSQRGLASRLCKPISTCVWPLPANGWVSLITLRGGSPRISSICWTRQTRVGTSWALSANQESASLSLWMLCRGVHLTLAVMVCSWLGNPLRDIDPCHGADRRRASPAYPWSQI